MANKTWNSTPFHIDNMIYTANCISIASNLFYVFMAFVCVCEYFPFSKPAVRIWVVANDDDNDNDNIAFYFWL